MTSSNTPHAGRAAQTLLSVALLVLAIVGAVLLWEPWATAPAGIEPAGRALDLAPTQPLATPGAEGAGLTPAKPGDAASETRLPGRARVSAHTILRGSFRPPSGFWPGGGHVELHPVAEMPEGGFMGVMSEALQAARQGDRGKLSTGSGGAQMQMQELFSPSEAKVRKPLDPRGAFAIEEPPPGHYRIELRHPHLRNDAVTEVEVAVGEDRDVGPLDTRLAGSLLVLVSNSDGRPVTDAELQLGREVDFAKFADTSALEDMPSLFRQFVPTKATTDDRGAHLFEGLEEGSWTLAVEAHGLVDDTRQVRVLPGRENLVRIELLAGASLEARVLGPDGTPHDSARLSIRHTDTANASIAFGSTVGSRGRGRKLRTGGDGRATASGLRPGPVEVRLGTPGFRQETQTVALEFGRRAQVEFRLDVGQSVSGRVLDEQGQPIRDAHVMHLAMLGQEFMGMDFGSLVGVDLLSLGIEQRGVPTDERGEFTLGGFEPGEEAHLIAAAPGFDPARQDDVAAGTTGVEFRLLRATSLSGVVVTEPGGEPVTDFEVRLEQRAWLVIDRPVVQGRFDGRGDGTFTLEAVPRDRFNAVVTAPGRAEWSESVDLSKGSADLGEIRLELPASIAGQVVDPLGAPVAGAKVRVAKGGAVDSMAFAQFFGNTVIESGDDGAFRIDGLTGRRVRLLADKAGFAPFKSKTISLDRGQTTAGVIMTLSRGGSLRGRIVDGRGTPLPDWTLQIQLANGRSLHSARTDEDGVFAVAGLADGTHKIEAHPGDYVKRFASDYSGFDPEAGKFDLSKMMDVALKWTVRDSVLIRDGEESEIELVFEEPGDDLQEQLTTVEGMVRVGGRELDHGMVSLFRAGSSSPVRMVHVRRGSFEMKGLQPGTYRARVQGGLLSAMIGERQVVQIPEAARYRLELELPGGVLAGRVVHSDDGRPASGVVLTLSSGGDDEAGLDRADVGEGTLLTGAEGEFRFEGVAAGHHEIYGKELQLTGGVGRSGRLGDLTLSAAEQRTGLELILRAGGTLRLTARDAVGPRAGALVTLLRADGRAVGLFHRTLTDPEGAVTMAGLPEGRYRANVDAPRTAPTITPIFDIQTGATRDVDVLLDPGVDVELELRGEIPARARGALVTYSLRRSDGALIRAGRLVIPRNANPGHKLDLGSFAPGRYHLRVESAAGLVETEREVKGRGSVVWVFEF